MNKRRKKSNKRLHKLALVLFVCMMVPVIGCIRCEAAEDELEASVNENVDKIIDDFYSAIPDGTVDASNIGSISESLGPKHILEQIFRVLSDRGSELGAFLLTLIGICMMNALASQARDEPGSYATRAVGIVSSVMLFDRLMFLVDGSVESIRKINEFFGAVIPVALAVNSVGVSPSTASAQAIGMGLTLGAYSHITSGLLSGVVTVIFVGSAASAIDPMFVRLSQGVKNIFLTLMGILTVLVGATFSLQTVISASADSALIRSARYAVSNTVPIVGGAISGVLGVALGCVSYARGIVGGGAIAVILSLVLSPLVVLFAYRLCLKAGAFFASLTSGESFSVFGPFLGALDALIAVYALTSVVYIGELVAFLKGGVSFA